MMQKSLKNFFALWCLFIGALCFAKGAAEASTNATNGTTNTNLKPATQNQLNANLEPAPQNVSIVTIQRAQHTKTSKNPTTNSDTVTFEGDVYLTIERGSEHVEIYADTVHYDRARKMIHAEGNVTMQEKSDGAYIRSMTGNALMLHSEKLSGIFDDMKIDARQVQNGKSLSDTVLIIDAEAFAKDSGGTIAFKNSTLTFCDDENPHWKIKASRVWLLPGNEIALFNGVFYIGHVPIAYLPIFYYPKDELIFNPVFGYRPRVGYFVQTTTYLIGRKPLLNTENTGGTVYQFTEQSNLMEQRREGLFLRNLDKPATVTSNDYLKVLADVYSNIGASGGVEGHFEPVNSFFTRIDFTSLFARSRNVYFTEDDALYSPYNIDQQSEWNDASIFGKSVPFRFKQELFVEGKCDELSLTLSLPFYSDPFFDADFAERSEHMDWLNFLTHTNLNTDDEFTRLQNATLSQYSWRFSGKYTPKIEAFSKYLNISVSFASSLDWASKKDASFALDSVAPSREFFYPAKITPLDLSVALSGTLIDYDEDAVNGANADVVTSVDNADGSSAGGASTSLNNASADGANLQEEIIEPTDVLDSLPFTALTMPTFTKKNISGIKYKLSYTITPRFQAIYTYTPDSWLSNTSKSWQDVLNSFVSANTDATLTSALSWRDDFFKLTNGITIEQDFQTHPIINSKYYSASALDAVRLSDYLNRKITITSTNALVIKPFVMYDFLEDTSVSWRTDLKLLRTAFTGTATSPVFSYVLPHFDRETFTENELEVKIATNIEPFKASFAVSAKLPPLLPSYKAQIDLSSKNFSTSLSSGIAVRSETDSSLYLLPFEESLSIKAFNQKLSLLQSFRYDLDAGHKDYFSFGANYEGLSFNLSAMMTNGYTYSAYNGWQNDGVEKFRPYQWSLSYNTPSDLAFSFWLDRISFVPSLSTSLVVDMVRPQKSYFTFNPGFTLKINELFDVNFSSSHRNDVVYRYVQGAVGIEPFLQGETNIIKDLFDSYNFGSELARRSSGFKVNSFNMEINHNLHDWVVHSKVRIQPELVTTGTRTYYDYSPYLSVSVVFKPTSALKATIVDERGSIQINP